MNWRCFWMLEFQFDINCSHGNYNWMLSIYSKIVSSGRNLSGFEMAIFTCNAIYNDHVYIINIIFILRSQFIARIWRLFLCMRYIVHVYYMWTNNRNQWRKYIRVSRETWRASSKQYVKIQMIFSFFIFSLWNFHWQSCENHCENVIGNDPILIVKYLKMNEKIEEMVKIVDFFMVKLNIIGFMGIAFLQTLGNYFVYDMGSDSYYLVTPLM